MKRTLSDFIGTDNVQANLPRFLLILIAAFLAITYIHGLTKSLLLERHFIDFSHYYYFAHELDSGVNIYNYTPAALETLHQSTALPVHVAGKPEYAPFFFFLMKPFTLLPFWTANFAWLLLNQAALLLCLYLAWLLVKTNDVAPALAASAIAVVFFASQPLIENAGVGQVNMFILLVLLLIALHCDAPDRYDLPNGTLLGLVILMKPQFGLLFLFFLMKGRFRLVLFTALSYVLYHLLGTFLYGRQIELSYWHNIIRNLIDAKGAFPNYHLGNISLRGIFCRLFHGGGVLSSVLYLSSALAVALVTLRVIVRTGKIALLAQYAFMVCCLLLISPLTEEHHLVLAVLPFLVALFHLKPGGKGMLLLFLAFLLIQVRYSFTSLSMFDTGILSLVHAGKTSGIFLLWLLFAREIRAATPAADSPRAGDTMQRSARNA